MRSLRAILPWICVALFVLGFANFFWFFAESLSIGGDALNGYARDGHYYVGSHGSYTEVSESTWQWSRFHASSIFVTHPLAIAAGFVLIASGGLARLIGLRTSADVRDARSAWVLTGEPRASGLLPIQVGGLPALRRSSVIVTDRGIVVRIGSEPIAVLAGEIRDVTPSAILTRSRLSVGHDGIDAPSPLVLTVVPEHTVAEAIVALREGVVSANPAPIPDALRTPTRRNDPIFVVMGVAGLVVIGVMLAIGVFEVIPNVGLFGWLWTGGVLAIGFVNTRRWWRSLND